MTITKTIAICNQKGGVGKTITCISLGAGLAREGKRVLLIDLDAQANLTMSLGYQSPDKLDTTIATMMMKVVNDEPFQRSEGILRHQEGFDFVPSNIQLAAVEPALMNAMNRERVLRNYLWKAKDRYDFVLIDCLPSLGLLTINALAAADSVIIPAQAHFLSMKGLEMLTKTITRVKEQINPKLYIEGVLLTMLDKRTVMTREVEALIRGQFAKLHIFETGIPASVRAQETGPEAKSIFAHDESGKIATAYAVLTQEVIRNGTRQRSQNPSLG